jgi:hypothetical protein
MNNYSLSMGTRAGGITGTTSDSRRSNFSLELDSGTWTWLFSLETAVMPSQILWRQRTAAGVL